MATLNLLIVSLLTIIVSVMIVIYAFSNRKTMQEVISYSLSFSPGSGGN